MYYGEDTSRDKRRQREIERARAQIYQDERLDEFIRDLERKYNPFCPGEPGEMEKVAKRNLHVQDIKPFLVEEAKKRTLPERYKELTEILCASIPKELAFILLDFYSPVESFREISQGYYYEECSYRDGYIVKKRVEHGDLTFIVKQRNAKFILIPIEKDCVPFSLVSTKDRSYMNGLLREMVLTFESTDPPFPCLTRLQKTPVKNEKLFLLIREVYQNNLVLLWRTELGQTPMKPLPTMSYLEADINREVLKENGWEKLPSFKEKTFLSEISDFLTLSNAFYKEFCLLRGKEVGEIHAVVIVRRTELVATPRFEKLIKIATELPFQSLKAEDN